MPKKSSNKSNWGGRGGGRPVNLEEKHYFGHDDRVGGRNDGGTVFVGNRPRVSFKAQTKPGKEKHRHLDLALKQHLDDDIQMNVGSNNNGRQVVLRGRGRGNYNSASRMRGRNSPLPQRMSNKFSRPVPLALADNSWYKVTIPYGFKYTKEFVLSNLMTHIAPDAFVPIMYKITAKEASFFVDNAVTASKLQKSDNQITTNDGFRLQVRVRPGAPPTCEMNDAMKERLKQAMTKRYLVESNALDLSRFHLDPELADDYFCPLFKPIMLMTVLDIIATHIPNLEALNLDGNKLQAIDRLSVLKSKFEKLKILHIGDNRIREINQIDSIKDLKLEELRLEGNPLCNKYKSRQTEYVSAVRKRFPKLLRLDGVVLPRPIMFDVTDEGVKLPPSQRIFVANPKAQEIASQFLHQYFMIFDSESRQPLLDAYHEHSCFSMTIASVLSANKPSGYLSENRNLYRLNDPNKRRKLLKLGRLPVVSFISEIPPTKHDLNSFTMDLSLATEGMMIITVTGLFKELDAKETLRFFNRTFVIVPQGSGYCIRNEQLHIGNPTDLQEKRAFSPIASEVSVSASPAGPSNVPPAYLEPSEEMKHNMFVALSQQTNMNAEWSRKCLEEVQWNFNNALAAFQEFFKHGQVPPEAFQK